jgi:Tol biopolymer transport system component
MRRIGVLAVIATAAACSSADHQVTAPPQKLASGLTIVSGNNQSDTIGATLPQLLEVRLVGPDSQPAAHSEIEFDGLLFNGTVYGPTVQLPGGNPAVSQMSLLAETDSTGRVAVQVVLGPENGVDRLRVSSRQYGYADTVRDTATVGHLVGVHFSSLRDTAMYKGSSFPLAAVAYDREGNVRPDTVTFSVASGPVSVSGSTLTGTDYGTAVALAQASGFTDTTHIAVVPHGTFATGDWADGLYTFDLDRTHTGYASFPLAASVNEAGTIRWAPSGTSFVYDQTSIGTCQMGRNELLTLTPQGQLIRAVDSSASTFEDEWPRYSRDGTWIYYTKAISNGPSSLWRVHPDGTNDDSLVIQNPGVDVHPSPSPDGTQLAYISRPAGGADLRILTIVTGAVTDLGITAWSPEWSPTSNQIAYLTHAGCRGQIAIVNADGSGQRSLTTDPYWANFDWSPDGQWIIATNGATNYDDLINVSTGLTIPLYNTWLRFSPTWLPTAGPAVSRVKSRPSRRF